MKCSSSEAIYSKLNHKLEKYCKIVSMAFDVALPGFVLPRAMHSFYMYFASNLGGDAFELPVPMPYDFYKFL